MSSTDPGGGKRRAVGIAWGQSSLIGFFSASSRRLEPYRRDFYKRDSRADSFSSIGGRAYAGCTQGAASREQNRRDATTDGLAFVPQDHAVPPSLTRHRQECRAGSAFGAASPARPSKPNLAGRFFCDYNSHKTNFISAILRASV
jgi:hypothetical protein